MPRMMNQELRPETLCVQAGWAPKKGEPRVLPIYQSTTFKYETSEQMAKLFDLEEAGFFYTRLQNPTNEAVARKIAELEGGVAAILTSSGQAASFFAIFNICEAGDHIVSASAIYGGTYNLFAVTFRKMGIEVTFVDQDAPAEEIAKAFRPNTKAFFAETISNPTLCVLDIRKMADIAHAHGVPLIVDNTFATPINCRPFEWGADIVTHSTTKYMDGHAAAVGGVIVDSGNFDWEAHKDKFPGSPTAKASAREPILPRRPSSSCAIWVPSNLRRMPFCSIWVWKPSTCVCRGIVKMRRKWRNSCKGRKMLPGLIIRVFLPMSIMNWRRSNSAVANLVVW